MKSPAEDPTILAEHHDFVRGLARSLVFDDASADDITQDVWLLALKHPSGEVRSIRAWLATIVRRVAYRAILRGNARVEREHRVAREEAIPSTDEILAREELRRDVIQAVLSLEEPYRSTVILRWFEGLSLRAIAERTHVERESVHTRLVRAHAMLRARLDREHGSRAIWAAAITSGMKLHPPVLPSLALAAKSVWPAGVWLMSGKKMVVASLALLLLASLAVWLVEFAPERSDERESAAGALLATPIARSESREPSIESAGGADDERSAVAKRPAESTPTIPPKQEGSLHLSVTWCDKSVAAGVGVTVYAWGGADPYHTAFVVKTDAAGSIRLDHVAVGFVSAILDRNHRAQCVAQIAAGQEVEKSIEIPRGLDIKGHVVDSDSRPVADADVYMNGFGMGEGFEGFIVARSGADGSFVARDVEHLTCLSARAPMRAPTIQHVIGGAAGESIEITLAFEAPGGELTGRVFGPDGRPVAFAQVLVGPQQRFEQFVLGDGSTALKPASQLSITNADGEFRFRGVELGTWPLQARAQGFAPIKVDVAIEPGRAVRREIELARACTVRGSVRDARGAPVSGAHVQAQPWGFASPLAVTTKQGEFALGNLPVGTFKLEVQADQRGRAEQTFIGEAGAELHADFQLSTGNTLKGRIVAPGEKLKDWVIDAQGMPGEPVYLDTSFTDVEGRFTFVNCPDIPLRLDVRRGGIYSVAHVENVRPGAEEVLIEPDPALMPSVKIRGRVVDGSGRPLAAGLMPTSPRFNVGSIESNDATTGRFEIGPFAPGEWRLKVSARGLASRGIGPSRLEPDAVWDVGDVVLKRGGSLTVRFARKDGREFALPNLSVRSSDGQWFRISASGDRAVSEPLNAGHYVMRIEADADGRTAADAIGFDMHEDEPQELQVMLQTGHRVTFELRGTTDTEPGVFAIEVLNSSREEVAALRFPGDAPAAQRGLWLSAGHYALTAHTGDANVSRAEFDVDPTGMAAPIPIEFH
jgi:RNA polymerase sigma-70 factor (ECF subfamily)